jgi:cytoskeletal protein CcmA (bactofilin family)
VTMIKQRMKYWTINAERRMSNRKGVALLVVLIVVMAITILSLGFLSRSDVELACGQNMMLRTQVDYLAESGLEHARGLILNPQDISSEYWTGEPNQQLVAGSDDYYDIEVVRATDRCNYIIDCNSYRLKDGERIGRSSIRAELRLDPCIALWIGNNATLWDGVTVKGDVYCNGTLTNCAPDEEIDGDVFADALNGNGEITGQLKPVADLPLEWPRVTVGYFTSNYPTQTISTSVLSGGPPLGPYDPVRVSYRHGDLILAGNVQIDGMLIVNGDLSVQGNLNIIRAAKNLPALLVTEDLIIGAGSLDINGLVVVNGSMQLSSDSADVSIIGGLFVEDGIVETTPDSSGYGNHGRWVGNSFYSTGIINQALSLDGTSTGSYVVVNHHGVLDGMSQLTLSAWAKKDISGIGGDIFLKHVVYRLQIGADKVRGYLFNTSGDRLDMTATSWSINDTQWHHYAITYDGATVLIYIDAQEVGLPRNFSGDVSTQPARSLYIGKYPWGDNFGGLIDDVQIYDRALSEVEIQEVKEGHAVQGIVGHWKLDGGCGNVTVTAAPSKTEILVWSQTGDVEKWGQAAGAFFRSIERR